MSRIEPVLGAIAVVSTVSNAINIVNKSHSFVKWANNKKKEFMENDKDTYETWQWVDEIEKDFIIIEK